MYVLVTGGAGFIGSHSVDALRAAGVALRVLDNFSNGKRENLSAHTDLDVQTGDITDPVAVAAAMDGITHVLHLAAQVSVQASVADPLHSCRQNVLGFVNVLDCARRLGVKRMVYASSAAVYGIPALLPLSEDAPTAPLSPYGLEKSINDQYAALYRDLFGFSALGLRYFNVYGPRQDPRSPYAGVISKFMERMAADEPLRVFGDGQQTRDFIYVKDIAQTNLAALRSDYSGICNVGTGSSVSLLQMIDALSAVLGQSLEVVFEPPQAGDIPKSATVNQRLQTQLGLKQFTSLHQGLGELLATESSK